MSRREPLPKFSSLLLGVLLSVVAVFVTVACKGDDKKSLENTRAHVVFMQESVNTDVGEVRTGLPQGAKHLAALFEKEQPPADNLSAVREALEKARDKVQDLRVAKSTFFAIVDERGVVLRNDQEQDLMVGKNIFTSFPKLKTALSGKYVETLGSMPEAAGVKGGDGQWVAAEPIRVAGKAKALYVTGWAWSSYAYRLENALRSRARGELKSERDKLPLLYVYVVVGDAAYGAPVSPVVNATAILEQKPLSKLKDGQYATTLEIAERQFSLVVGKTEALGADVGVAVLRSET